MNLFRRSKAEPEARREFSSWQVIPPAATPAKPPPPATDETAVEEAADEKRPRQRRRSTRPRNGAGRTDKELLSLTEPVVPEEPLPSEKPKATATRSRSRRGPARPARSEKPTLPAAPDTSALKGDSRVMAELVLRQTTALENFGDRQLGAMDEVKRSMEALGERLDRGAASSRLPRCGIFVDVPNIIYTADRLRARIDFGKLLDLLTEGREMVRASAYAPISDDPTQSLETQRFVQPFVDRGYKIVTKPLKRFADGSIKANFDVELAIDILTMADRLDIVCLVSGDGDFRRLVEIVESKGVRVEVVAFAQSTAVELRTMADEYVELGSILDRIT
jgi:uncharacterized LabA/DUF88 family protein